MASFGTGLAAIAIPAGIVWSGIQIVNRIADDMDAAQERLNRLKEQRNQFLLDLQDVAGNSLALDVQEILVAELPTMTTEFGELVVDALRQGLELNQTPEQIAQQLRNLFKFGLQQGMVTPDEAINFDQFVTNIQTSLSSAVQKGVQGFVSASATRETLPLDQIIGNVAANAQSNAGTQNLQDLVAQAIATPVQNGIAAGLNQETISALVFDNISAGVIAGLDASDPATIAAVNTFIESLTSFMAAAAEIESPSGLFAREIGVPIGEGILVGIEQVSDTIATSPQLKKILDALIAPFESSREAVVTSLQLLKKESESELKKITSTLTTIYQTFFDGIKAKLVIFRIDNKNAWIGIRTDTNIEVTGMKDDVLRVLDTLREGLRELMGRIYDLIITNGFKKIHTDAVTEIGLMRVAIVKALTDPEDSLLADLNKLIGDATENSPAWNIGKNLIAGMAQGVTDNTKLLVNAFKAAIKTTFEETAKEYEVQSPSKVAARELGKPLSEGIAIGITQGIPSILASVRSAITGALSPSSLFPSRPPTFQPSSVSNVVNNRTYQLNVNSSQASQGIVGDFAIMEVMGGV